MTEICDSELCTGCGVCFAICPTKSIKFKENDEGFIFPVIEQDQCISCGLCKMNCPILNDFETRRKDVIRSRYGWSSNAEVRFNSSSGGVFSEIAENVIKKGGVVYGAAYGNGLRLLHIGIECVDELYKLRGSKYYQSDISKSFAEVKQYLEIGRTVLFSGTGCQIDALYQYLERVDITNLLTVEILCHGVPSRKAVNRHAETLYSNSNIMSLRFRDKSKYGWKYSCVFNIKYNDGYEYYGKSSSDLFYLGFLNEVLLRESCYSCKYVGKRRVGDILLADFWGIDNESQYEIDQHDLELGISFIATNSEKGETILQILADNGSISIYDADYDIASKYNTALITNYQRPSQRDIIYKNIDSLGYKRAIIRAFPITYLRIVLHKVIKAILRYDS